MVRKNIIKLLEIAHFFLARPKTNRQSELYTRCTLIWGLLTEDQTSSIYAFIEINYWIITKVNENHFFP